MKKSTVTFLLLLFVCVTVLCCACIVAKAQPPIKKDTVKKSSYTKPKYNYFVVIPAGDYQQIFGALTEYKSLQMYNPGSNDAEKVTLFKAIDAYLKDFPKRIKIDSILIKQ
jgi:hypothetical protein